MNSKLQKHVWGKLTNLPAFSYLSMLAFSILSAMDS